MSVEQIIRLYAEGGHEMFRKAIWYRRLKAKFQSEGLRQVFQKLFSEDGHGLNPATLGSDRLKTYLLVVTRNASTGSPWPITNNPNAKYNKKGTPGCNLELPLWQLVRASTAAPAYFPPEVVTIYGADKFSKGVQCAFEDGGVTPYNNPAFLLYLKATLPEYQMGWPTGTDRISLLSIGTGMEPPGREKHEISLLEAASAVPSTLISGVANNQDLICRVHGDCRFGPPLDSELGDLIRPNPHAHFTYTRYDHQFTKDELAEAKSISKLGITLDNLDLMPFLMEIGSRYAAKNVSLAHFHRPDPA
ncbi:MAG: patatin [Verrucomicrobia bacterium]|nr:patatin [Verrucomicrobiota bacterium]MDA1007308.1 patatin [Verrucomicrobiota bacterium]